MLVCPVRAAVTQARIQLVADQTEKAPPHIISEDVLDMFAAKNRAKREALVDRQAKPAHARRHQAAKRSCSARAFWI